MDNPANPDNPDTLWTTPTVLAAARGLSPRTIRRHCRALTANPAAPWTLDGVLAIEQTPGGQWRLLIPTSEVSA